MAGDDSSPVEEQPQPFNATKLEAAKKRRRSRSPSNYTPKRLDSKRSPSPSNGAKARRTPSPPPRKQKRPGQRARITDAEREHIRQKQLEREKEIAAAAAAQGIHNAVREHYNAVPERGRDWRKTDSRIKGLRSFNNWVKSTLIQKFSPNEDYTPGAHERGGEVYGGDTEASKGLLVLDLGCGKCGDLGKWQKAPQSVELYVGLDPADVSIDQAKERYRQMSSRGGGGRGGRGRGGYSSRPPPRLFQGEFYVQDCFGEQIDKVPLVRDVGFDGSGGPSRFGGGGFDVVSMMFCMHYAFESEAKARQMLKNVAGALKKGGRLIGCIPSSDVLSGRVKEFNERMAAKSKPATGDDSKADDKEDEGEIEEGEAEETAAWSNDIYRVRFPGKTPADGIFRPPFGWKYNYFLHEAVEEVPEYVVPWEAFRALAEEYNLEMQYHKHFDAIWRTEKDDEVLGPLSEQMGVRERGRGPLLVSDEEMEAASFYVGFCFYKV